MSDAEEFDVIVVGAGLAGLAAANEIAKGGMQVIVLERGDQAGAKNLSGGRLYLDPLRDLVGDLLDGAPFERTVVAESVVLLGPETSVSLRVDSQAREPGQHSVTVLRAKLDAFLADKLAEKDVFVLPEQRAESLVVEGERIVGIRVGEEVLRAPVIVGADGVLSFLAEEGGLRKRRDPDHYGVGIKEIIRLDKNVINDRFNVEDGTGEARIYLGEMTAGIPGGGFLYTNIDSISIGLVLHVSALKDWQSKDKLWQLLEAFKNRKDIAPLLRGGQFAEYGAHLLPEGGLSAMPSLGRDGLLLVGDAAGLSINTGMTVRGMDLAMASGVLAGRSIVDAGGDPIQALRLYEKNLGESFVMEQMRAHRKSRGLLSLERLYNYYPGPIGEICRDMFQVDRDGKSPSIGQVFKRLRKDVLGWQGLGDVWRLSRM